MALARHGKLPGSHGRGQARSPRLGMPPAGRLGGYGLSSWLHLLRHGNLRKIASWPVPGMPAAGLVLLARGDECVAEAHAVDGEASALAPAFVCALQCCGLRRREPAARRFVGQAVAERRAVLGPLDGPHGSDDQVELPAAEAKGLHRCAAGKPARGRVTDELFGVHGCTSWCTKLFVNATGCPQNGADL